MECLGLIVAMTLDRVIGVDGGLPWHISEDLKYFRKHTLGHSILMGRKTYESIGRPLPKRRNIVITRAADAHYDGCEVANDVDAAITLARETDDCPMIIGGAAIYEACLPQVTRLFVTEVRRKITGDTFFPALPTGLFEEVGRVSATEHSDVDFVTLERSATSA